MKNKFLDLGMQPIANNFLPHPPQVPGEYMYNLVVTFDDKTKLVSLEEFVPPELMFNDSYVYHSSASRTMRDHFKDTAHALKSEFNPRRVLEIGSNDGVFVRYFPVATTSAVEPCGNFASITTEMGYRTIPSFWNTTTAHEILHEFGTQDLIFSANCMCHIQDLEDAFAAIAKVLSKEGVLVFEDPSLLKMIERGSYDQIYDEHAHIFSITALKNVLAKVALEIFRVEESSVHGSVDYAFLGAWNFEDEIASKEEEFRSHGRFITHVPYVRFI